MKKRVLIVMYLSFILIVLLSLIGYNIDLSFKKEELKKFQQKETLDFKRQDGIQNNAIKEIKNIINNIDINKTKTDSIFIPTVVEIEKPIYNPDPKQDSIIAYLESQLPVNNPPKYDTFIKVENVYIIDTIVKVSKDTIVINDTVLLSKKKLKK